MLRPGLALLLVSLILLGYSVLSALSMRPGRVGITYDEPLHAVGAWHIRYASDYRVNREDPALFLRYLSLWTARSDVAAPYDDVAWRETRQGTFAPRDYLRRAVYGEVAAATPAGFVPERVVRSARAGALLLSILLIAASAGLAWTAAGDRHGPLAAVVTAATLALDPLVLGHGILAKNDVAMALVLVLVAACLRGVVRGGQTGMRWLAGLLLCSASAPLVKFSGVLVGPVVVIVLVVRALSGREWPIGNLRLTTRTRRTYFAAGTAVAALAVFVALCWACYGFRFAAHPGPERISVSSLLGLTAGFDYRARFPDGPTPPPRSFTDNWEPPMAVDAAVFAYRRQLLPEAFLTGFIYTYASSLYRPSFLLGEIRGTGWWYYFPLAWLFKTPLSLVLLAAGAAVVAAGALGRGRYSAWLIVPPGVFLLAAMTSNLNIGLRHILPVVPFVAIGIGLASAHVAVRWPRGALIALAGLFVCLAAEVVPKAGGHIQFFNLAAGGSRGGLRLLSDSNLDWGQDLPALYAYRGRHPDETLYLYRFGHFTDLRPLGAINLAAGDPGDGPGTLAISATLLQGLYVSDPAAREYLRSLRQTPPRTTLNGTIYLYDVPARPPLPPR
jgi:hypothetical protein